MFCVADIQGLFGYRSEFVTFKQWLVPVATYALGAGLILWKWDWLARVVVSWRFAVVAVALVAAIAGASTRSAPSREAGVPLLRAGERERLPLQPHAMQPAVQAGWVLPNPGAFAGSTGGLGDGQQSAQSDFDYDLPKGWAAKTSTNMRPINLRAGSDPRAECYLTVLPGSAGGTLDNVNRWREQMQAAPIDEAALAKLPRAKLLGREAVVVEIDGTFTGMQGGPLADARMVGAIASLPAVTLFLKMTGPRAEVEKERAAFDGLLASIRMRSAAPSRPAEKAEDPHGDPHAPAAGGGEGLRWTAPDGWTAGAARPMRVVTFTPRGTTGLECYVTVLPGGAGGVLDNVNRWRDQFGARPQTQAEVDALPKEKVLGQDAPVVELAGTFTGMGSGPKADQALLGTMVPLEDAMVFVKMTGPKEQVKAERERFLAFCRSLGRQ